ncbi:MAG: lysophospholipid acyltransferase family protein [Chitinophagaceae bacterium]
MNPIKNIAGKIYLVYLLLVFIITMLPAYIATLLILGLPEPRRSKALHGIFVVWMNVFMPLVFCPVRRKGTGYFEPGKNYVVVCNHNSFIDIPVSSPWIPGANKTLAKVEIAKVPLFGLIYKTGSILVDRESEKSRKESFTAMRETLRMGLHLCLYPEGTRNKTNEPLQEFQDGAFVVAIREQKPVMPALIFNTGKILPHQYGFWGRPCPVELHFLPPVETAGMSLKELPALKAQIWQTMHDYYLTNKRA